MISFPEVDDAFIANLKSLILRYADQNGWDVVAVNLSKGLARQILDDITEIPLPHTGTIVIDPSGTTPDYQVYDRDSALKAAHERLTMVNEVNKDIMIIIYGIDEMTRDVLLNLLMRRARMTSTTLDLLDDEPEVTINHDADSPWRTTEGRRRLVLARQQAGLMLEGLREAELGTVIDHTGNLISPNTSAIYISLMACMYELAKLADNPTLYRSLAAAHGGLINWYRDFARQGLILPEPPPGVTLPRYTPKSSQGHFAPAPEPN